jgi:hypothetical protein
VYYFGQTEKENNFVPKVLVHHMARNPGKNIPDHFKEKEKLQWGSFNSIMLNNIFTWGVNFRAFFTPIYCRK